jgi:hypothetical protein
MGHLASVDFDVAILGGGPLACAIARDAVGRGLRIVLSAPGDLGGDIGQHILSCGRANMPHLTLEYQTELQIMERICPQIFNESAAPIGGFFKSLFGPKHPAPLTALCVTATNRFTILNARDAAERGAVILPHSTATIRTLGDAFWQIDIAANRGTPSFSVSSRILVDTRGAESAKLSGKIGRVAVFDTDTPPCDKTISDPSLGSFVVKFLDKNTAIGLISSTEISESELMDHARSLGFSSAPMWVFALLDAPESPAKLDISGTPALFSIADTAAFGWRKLAEDIVAEMAPYVQMIGKRWTSFAALPGGDFQPAIRTDLILALLQTVPHIAPSILNRLFFSYGTECSQFLCKPGDLGIHFGAGLYEAEVRWLLNEEWASSSRDILWRRTALGILLSPDETVKLDSWIAQNLSIQGAEDHFRTS